jgi:hypothetical protein
MYGGLVKRVLTALRGYLCKRLMIENRGVPFNLLSKKHFIFFGPE